MSTILVVDDEPLARDTLEGLLVPEGYSVVLAANGPEALARAAEVTPDVILLDVMMPAMNGFEVCSRLRADPQLAEVPIIMVTALDDRASRVRGIEAGADDFVSKPFDSIELRARIRTTVKLNRYRRLLTERAKFEWAVERSVDGYLIVNREDAIVYANPRARFYLSMPQEGPARFMELAQRQYHCEPEEAWAAWPHVCESEQSCFLVRPESPTSKAFWLQVSALDLPSNTDRIIHLHDVTDQMTSQRNEWEFHSLVRHKLSTPLTSMLLSLEFLQEIASLPAEEAAELARMAASGASRLQSQADDIFQYLLAPRLAQPDGRIGLSHLRPMIAQVSADLDLQSVSVSVQEQPDDPQITLSRQAIELILLEVLENAKKFHPQQTPQVEVAIFRMDARAVRLTISDDGLTLSPEQLTHVWTPYYQGEKYFTGQVKGMGLGLPRVANLVWSAGGTTHLYNRADQPGVVVELVLPLAS